MMYTCMQPCNLKILFQAKVWFRFSCNFQPYSHHDFEKSWCPVSATRKIWSSWNARGMCNEVQEKCKSHGQFVIVCFLFEASLVKIELVVELISSKFPLCYCYVLSLSYHHMELARWGLKLIHPSMWQLMFNRFLYITNTEVHTIYD